MSLVGAPATAAWRPPPRLPATAVRVDASALAAERFPAAVRWSLYLFAFSLPFEMPNHSLPVDNPTATASIFLLATLLAPKRCYGRMPWAAVWFGVFLYVFAVASALANPFHLGEALKFFSWLLQLWLVLWAGSNVLRAERIARSAILSLGAGAFVRASMQLVGLGRTSHAVWTGGERVTAFGQNANMAAMVLGAGIIGLVGLAASGRRTLPFPRLFVWPMCAAIGVAMIQTGSRGGLLALTVGLCVFLLGAKGARTRARNTVIAVFAIAFLGVMADRSTMMRSRLEDSAETGTMAGREHIYPAAWAMFKERPVLGWGPVNNKYVLGGRLAEQLRRRRDTHNLLLEVLTSTGVVGAIPFMLVLALGIRGCLQARHGPHGALPLAFMSAVLVANSSGNWIASKLLWVVLAFAIAAGAEAAAARRRTANGSAAAPWLPGWQPPSR